MLNNPWLAMLITLILCIVWMRAINLLASKRIISSTISRKLIHIGTGPVYLLCWLLFPDTGLSRYLAAAIPLLIVLQVFIVGLGILKDYTSVQSMSRTGEKQELLKGPLFYGIVFVIVTIFFWKTIDAVIALMILCGGDGAADLIGSRIRSAYLPWNRNKTIAGSLSMVIAGAILALMMIFLVIQPTGLEKNIVQTSWFSVLLISIVATLVESVTPSDYDNLTVPAISLIFSTILL